jgi:hypothetical protein
MAHENGKMRAGHCGSFMIHVNNSNAFSPSSASGRLVIGIKWVFVGEPLTPNALKDGKANFLEFHNVYIEPGSYEIYKKTGEFPGRCDRLARIQTEDSAMTLQLGPPI